MKKFVAISLILLFSLSVFAQEVIYYDEKYQRDTSYVRLINAYCESGNSAYRSEALANAKDFFSTSHVTLSNSAFQITEGILFENHFAPMTEDKNFVTQIGKFIRSYFKAFKDASKNQLCMDKAFSEKNKKFRAISDAEYLYSKYNSLYSSRTQQVKFSDDDMIEILNNPYELYAILNNKKYENLQRSLVDSLLSYFEKSSFILNTDFDHESFIIFPTCISEFYCQLSDDDRKDEIMELYEFSYLLNQVYAYAESTGISFGSLFLPDEASVFQDIFDDSFCFFAMTDKTRIYLTQRLKAIKFILME